MSEILLGVAMFTAVILLLVGVLLARQAQAGRARRRVDPHQRRSRQGRCACPPATRCSARSPSSKIFIPSACGGKGACGVCEVIVKEGGGDLLPTETGYISRGEAKRGCRLACQVKVKRDMKIEIAPEVFSVRKWHVQGHLQPQRRDVHQGAEARAARGRGGAVPRRRLRADRVPAAHASSSATFDIDPQFRDDVGPLRPLALQVGRPRRRSSARTRWRTTRTRRASCCSRSASRSRRSTARTSRPGIMSSWIFSLKPGDEVTVSGPFGEFFARDTDKEMCFIGGGAGMAPMRSHIFDQFKRLHTKRKATFWYGARSLREAFYVDEFEALAEGEPELHVAPRAVRAAARGQLDRADRVHPQRAARPLPEGPPGARGHRVLHVRPGRR